MPGAFLRREKVGRFSPVELEEQEAIQSKLRHLAQQVPREAHGGAGLLRCDGESGSG